MNFETNTPADIVKEIQDSSATLVTLNNQETIERLVPTDALFVVAIQGVERELNESFVTAGLAPTMTGVRVDLGADNGLKGRFYGYLIVTPGRLIILSDAQKYFDEPIANTRVAPDKGEYVIYGATKKIKLSSLLPIIAPNGRFQSATSGFQGATPLLTQLQNQGSAIKKVSSIQTTIGYILFVLIFAGIISLALFNK